MLIKPLLLAGIGLIVTAAVFATGKEEPMTKPSAALSDGTAGYLTPFEACEHSPGKKKVEAECATLTVPENWDDPDSRLIELPVVRFAPKSDVPAEPVFILLGGPGASNLITYPKDWLLETRDVILVGYRGVDGSVDLVCPEVSDLSKKYLEKAFLSDQANAELSSAAR